MKLIIVPGNSLMHKEWSLKAKEVLSEFFDEVHVLFYSHWETEGSVLDFDVELDKLVSLTKNIGEYMVFAKSAGSLLTMRGVHEGVIDPKKCFFLGVPFVWAHKNNFPVEYWVKNFSIPTRIIQQEFDRTCSALELEKFLKEYAISNYTMKVIPGEDHYYSDWEDITREVGLLL
ncbi:MAG: hypothetical protein WC444_03680 [Candidatus Paceibacterota bacterium]